jgi:hypothetical protein
MLDPYTPAEKAAQGNGAIPTIPGLDELSYSPELAAHQQNQQQYQNEQLRAQQQALEFQHATAAREAQTGIAQDIADPNLQKGWNELTPQQRTAQQAKYSPLVWGDLPTMHNTAVSTATGRPVGANIQPGEVASGEVAGTKLSNIQPPPTAGATSAMEGLAPQEQGMANEIANYRYPYQALSRIPGPQRIRVLNAAAEVNPDFDANQYQTRQGVMKSFGSGQDAGNIASANTIVEHLDKWLKAGEALHNRSFEPWNSVANKTAEVFGSPAPTVFQSTADAVASELAKLFKGSGNANVQEIKEWRDNLSPKMSPDQIKAQAQTIINLMDGRLDALKTKWEQGMGTPRQSGFLSPQARQILESHGLSSAESTTPAQNTAPAPQTPQPQQLTPQDQAAIQWAQQNPNDPRAARILQLHGIK